MKGLDVDKAFVVSNAYLFTKYTHSPYLQPTQ